jgi:hypothetical protein
MKYPSGTIRQGGLTHQRGDYGHENIYYPVIGVVLNTFYSDDHRNTLSGGHADRRGSSCQARVMLVKGKVGDSSILPNVLILPRGSTGRDDFSEELPTPTTGTVDGSSFRSDFKGINATKLNGDWCVIHFINGSKRQPVMLEWFPHPSNRRDATTKDSDLGNLVQGRRIARRFQGLRLVVTSEGSILVDTSQSNHPLSVDQVSREKNESGGDVRVTIKKERELEINFNPPIFAVKNGVPVEPDFLHPPNRIPEDPDARETTATRLLADKNFIRLLAGQVAEISGSKIALGLEPSATENLVLGQELKALLVKILNALLTHTHGTGVGPSGAPQAPALTEFSDALTSVQAEEQLANWIFAQKDPP